ncbi:hypothetical protein GPY44_24430 [Photorhabdus laumondii subsp. laumondii]|nr:hypothetical protein [Photorhabdus laumondii subsp. laumondii]
MATENNAHLSEYDGDALRDVVRPSVRIRYRAESGQRSLPESGKRHQLSGK